jgi:hypothetical protein
VIKLYVKGINFAKFEPQAIYLNECAFCAEAWLLADPQNDKWQNYALAKNAKSFLTV